MGAVFHGVQSEVDFRERLLLLDGAHSTVKVLGLVDIVLLVILHGGRLLLTGVGKA